MKKTVFGRSTANIRQRDICLLDFPFSDFESSKLRPALVASNSRYNCAQEDILAIPLTSRAKPMPYSIGVTDENLECGRLAMASRIRCDKIVSVEKARVVGRIGRLNAETFEQVKTEVFAVLAE